MPTSVQMHRSTILAYASKSTKAARLRALSSLGTITKTGGSIWWGPKTTDLDKRVETLNAKIAGLKFEGDATPLKAQYSFWRRKWQEWRDAHESPPTPFGEFTESEQSEYQEFDNKYNEFDGRYAAARSVELSSATPKVEPLPPLKPGEAPLPIPVIPSVATQAKADSGIGVGGIVMLAAIGAVIWFVVRGA